MSHTLTPPLLTNTSALYAPSIAKAARSGPGSGRVRRIAWEPRLDLGINASSAYFNPSKDRALRTTRARGRVDVAVAKVSRFHPNSESYSYRTQYGQAPEQQGNSVAADPMFLSDQDIRNIFQLLFG